MWIIKLKTFLKSFMFHIWAGSPKSSQSEIDSRYRICLSCEKFRVAKSECGICGCSVNNRKIFMNKLAWADQECPINKWSKINKEK